MISPLSLPSPSLRDNQHQPHQPHHQKPSDGCIWVASFDPGLVNFAFIIEEFNPSNIESIVKVKDKYRFKSDGTPTADYNKLLKSVYSEGKVILVRNIDLTKGITKKAKQLSSSVYINFINEFDKLSPFWDHCSVFLIEQQFRKMAIKIAQHCRSYFTVLYKNFSGKIITEYSSRHKTHKLGSKRGINRPQRKLWSIELSKRILSSRGEHNVINQIESYKKQDDICDCLIQLQSFKIVFFIYQKFSPL